MKVLVLLAMVAIVIALATGGFFLVKDAGQSERTLSALKWRIGLSVTLFALLFLGWALGFIHPHALGQ